MGSLSELLLQPDFDYCEKLNLLAVTKSCIYSVNCPYSNNCPHSLPEEWKPWWKKTPSNYRPSPGLPLLVLIQTWSLAKAFLICRRIYFYAPFPKDDIVCRSHYPTLQVPWEASQGISVETEWTYTQHTDRADNQSAICTIYPPISTPPPL